MRRRLSAILLVITLLALTGTNHFAAAQSIDCALAPKLTISGSVPLNGTYAIWLLTRTETPEAVTYLSIDDENTCTQLDQPAGTGWEWVSGGSGLLKRQLSAGKHDFRIAVNGGAVLVDKVLVTDDTNCTPKDDGGNCLEKTLDFIVDGIEQGAEVSGTRRVSAVLGQDSVATASFDFSIDGNVVATQQSAPFCLVDGEGDTCGLYDFSGLAPGSHTLVVTGTSPGDQVLEKTITFSVSKANTLPTSDQTAIQNNDNDLPDSITLAVSGLNDGESVSGTRKISATANGAPDLKVNFMINNVTYSNDSNAPYCMVAGAQAGECGDWDSTSLVNGDYQLYVVASASGYRTKAVTVPFSISNQIPVAAVENKDQTVVVGNPGQQAAGVVTVTLPQRVLQDANAGRRITYRLDGEVIGEAYDSNPAVSLDTTELTNGKHELTAHITSVNGETSVITSEINVRNDLASASASWLRKNLLLVIAGSVGMALGVYLTVRLIMRFVQKRRFNEQHNLVGTYDYAHSYPWYSPQNKYAQVFGVFLVLFIGTGLAFQFRGVTYAGAGVGFIEEAENGIGSDGFGGLSTAYDEHMTLYARLNYTQAAPEIPVPPSREGGESPVSRIQGEALELAAGLGRVQSAQADGNQELMIWSTGAAARSVTTTAGAGLVIRARGDQCNGAPVMAVTVDGTEVFRTDVSSSGYADYGYPYTITAAAHTITVQFTNDGTSGCDRNLYIDYIDIVASAPQPSPAPSVPAPTAPSGGSTGQTGSTGGSTGGGTSSGGSSVGTGTGQHNGMGPVINNSLIPGPFPAAYSPLLYYNTGYVPFSDEIGAFRTDCRVSHISYDDPIVYPGVPGGAHLHTFFGNSDADAYSTASSIMNTGGSTCNGGTLNRTAYWMPTVINTRTGAPVMPERVLVYYKTSYYGVAPQAVIAPPDGLRMIAGDSKATAPQARDPYGHSISSFACNSEFDPFPVVTAGVSIDTYCPEGARQLYMEIRFPQCWDGRNLDSFDHKSHMAYPTGYGCPASHPVGIPEIQLRVKYNYYDPDRPYWRLSSDNYASGPGGYSSHADWFNGWNRDILNQISANCWNASRDCQVDNIGNGQKLAPGP